MIPLESLEREFQAQLREIHQPLHKLQTQAWERFLAIGVPLSDQEKYKNIHLRDLYRHRYHLCTKDEGGQGEFSSSHSPHRLVFINGIYREELSTINQLPKGVQILPLTKAISSFGAFLQPFFAKEIKEEKDPFVILNTAFFQEGVFIYVSPKVVLEEPIEVVHWNAPEQSRALLSPRLVFFAGKESRSRLIWKTHSVGKYWWNGKIDMILEEGAFCDFYPIEAESPENWYFQTCRAHLKKGAHWSTVGFLSGCRTMRHAFEVVLGGEGADASLQLAWSLEKNAQAHVHVLMDHQEPHTTSLQRCKGLVNDHGKSYFAGQIYVHSKAQKTQAYQMNPHLLLSDEAKAVSSPMLEIFADDVKASHGATVGQLNPEDLFYLQSRGLSLEEARKLLVQGFVKEVIDLIPFNALRKEALCLACF